MEINVREIQASEMPSIYPFIRQLNPDMSEETFRERLSQMLTQGYRCAVAEDSAGNWLGISGFWQFTRFWCGAHIDIDNVVIDEQHRNKGVGKKLVEWVESWAKQRGYGFAVLDSYAHNIDSHRFYYREGYVIRGFHFTKHLK